MRDHMFGGVCRRCKHAKVAPHRHRTPGTGIYPYRVSRRWRWGTIWVTLKKLTSLPTRLFWYTLKPQQYENRLFYQHPKFVTLYTWRCSRIESQCWRRYLDKTQCRHGNSTCILNSESSSTAILCPILQVDICFNGTHLGVWGQDSGVGYFYQLSAHF